eukprot:TRINITY_DN8261_c0_g1_i1.p1 TRINITY_DN8261_c0_g1~~TRINITY_DN8261_c0_g1_i1.p1  ORF type:complete len:108 (-),score=16.61 TRINITY_DN8261_c0_g1_i1:46-369(-)
MGLRYLLTPYSSLLFILPYHSKDVPYRLFGDSLEGLLKYCRCVLGAKVDRVVKNILIHDILVVGVVVLFVGTLSTCCLLYTSDAADEEDSVDLGGRRIIQKKNKIDY